MKKAEKKAVILARSSGDQEAVDVQVNTLRKFAVKSGLTVVDTISMPNTASSDHVMRKQLESLFQRRREIADFETILVTDFDRLVRGMDRGQYLLHDLSKQGINVVTPFSGKRFIAMSRCSYPGCAQSLSRKTVSRKGGNVRVSHAEKDQNHPKNKTQANDCGRR